MFRRVVPIVMAVLSLALVAPPAAAAVRPAVLRQLLEAEHTAGMPGAYAVVRDGRDAWAGAAGVADIETGRPASPSFRHRIGSITKTFVATTVLQLVGERRVRLDAPAGRYLPRLGIPPEVTVRMLLDHTSGLGNYTTALITGENDLERLRHTTYTPRELVAIGLSLPPTGAPGAGWSYSNTNYVVLGLLIERVTGHRYDAEISRRILYPLGLRSTSFPGVDPYLRGPHSRAYVQWSDGSLRDFSVMNMSWGGAAGEMVSTMADLNRFFRALLSGRLLSPALLAEMKTTVPFDPAVPAAGGYGLGLFWLPLPCGPAWGHNGGVIGQTTVSLHSPDGRRQVSLGENMIYNDPGAIDQARAAFLTEALCGPATVRTTATATATVPMPRTADVLLRR
jgi:D-alanyl-D-alanine carboxypeptidase